jgi:hypothetical protein
MAVRLLALDPLQEPVHRALMRLYVRQGRRGSALRQYQTCLTVVLEDLLGRPELRSRGHPSFAFTAAGAAAKTSATASAAREMRRREKRGGVSMIQAVPLSPSSWSGFGSSAPGLGRPRRPRRPPARRASLIAPGVGWNRDGSVKGP